MTPTPNPTTPQPAARGVFPMKSQTPHRKLLYGKLHARTKTNMKGRQAPQSSLIIPAMIKHEAAINLHSNLLILLALKP